jgi:hypothetical protein
MKRLKGLTLALACGLVLVASGASLAQGTPQDDKSKKGESCCAMKEGKEGKDKEDCCKGDSCCKKESCCCKGDECPMHPHDTRKTGQ